MLDNQLNDTATKEALQGDKIPVANEDGYHSYLMTHGSSDCCMAAVEQELLHVYCSSCGEFCSVILI